jgi:hypothetical protein
MLIYAGDSWAAKAWTDENYQKRHPSVGDVRMADFWEIKYKWMFSNAISNLTVLDRIAHRGTKDPIVWIYTEPVRDYNRITGAPEFEWISREDFFEIRKELDEYTLRKIRSTIDNPIALIGGLSDINTVLAESLGFTVLHPSWQQWIAETLDRMDYFEFGWGAADIGWRTGQHPELKPSKTVIFAWDRLIQEWCLWDDLGYFRHDHPTVRANKEFAEFLKPRVIEWYNNVVK